MDDTPQGVSQAVNLTLGQRYRSRILWEAGGSPREGARTVCELTELTAAELTLQLYGSECQCSIASDCVRVQVP